MGLSLKFKGKWRAYQQRVLDSLSFHLADEKLHVVAAPGAGKTTLGIEVISRINTPALVLCPTNTIKNQWKERICTSFLDEADWGIVSTDIRNPGKLTIITYQALLAAFCGRFDDDGIADDITDTITDIFDFAEESITSSRRFSQNKADEIIEVLKKANISLLVFDEAHHLRKEWWKALTYLVDNLEPRQTAAFTATPPYDVDYSEWERYEELCGSIDEAISIPELIKNGDLCPHQDFIYFSRLRKGESAVVKKQNQAVAQFLEKILSDNTLYAYIQAMQFLNPSDSDVEKIFDDSDFYVSVAALINTKGGVVPKAFLQLFDIKKSELPRFNLQQAKFFSNGFLFKHVEEFAELEEKIAEYTNFARKLGLIQNKKIVLNESSKVQKQMANSLGKLDSIVDIVRIESASLGETLRMVVLADYIKANDVDNSHLGVVPIWRTLKCEYGSSIPFGILCGSLIVIPENCENLFRELLKEYNVDEDCVSVSRYVEDSSYIKITPKASAKHCIVSLITEMFSRGAIRVLIGTQALLGEGWDAPCINSLILSSTVSSYMLSNQMRGRAIRIDKNNPDKVSNIWHLASVMVPDASDYNIVNELSKLVTVDSDFEDIDRAAYYDLNQLRKRFEGYEAPSYYGDHEIVSGIARVLSDDFEIKLSLFKEIVFTDLNSLAISYAKDRELTKKWWNDSLYLGYSSSSACSLQRGVDAPKMTAKSLTYTGYKDLLYSLPGFFFTAIYIIAYFPKSLVSSFLILLFVVFLVVLIWIGIRYLKTGTVEGLIKQIAIAHLETLSALGFVRSDLNNVSFRTKEIVGSVQITCKNLPVEENNLLIKCMQEFLDPIENPRYILVRCVRQWGIIPSYDYFAIPSVLSARKSDVNMFMQFFKKYVGGECMEVYTRNLDGRKILLKARKNAFSSIKRKRSKKFSKWQ